MIISSAHLYGKQISASGKVPHPNWLVFGGECNPELMPAGYTNFNDMLVTLTGTIGQMWYDLQYSKLVQNYIGTPHIIQLKGTNADSWVKDGGFLKRTQSVVPPGVDLVNYYCSELMIPVRIGTKFSKIHVSYSYEGEEPEYRDAIYAELKMQYGRKSGDSSYGNLYVGLSDYGYPMTAGSYTDSYDIPSFPSWSDGWEYVGFFPTIVTKTIKIDEIWFE